MEPEYLIRIAEALERIADHFDSTKNASIDVVAVLPDWLTESNTHVLAKELHDFVTKNTKQKNFPITYLDYELSEKFWKEKGMEDPFLYPLINKIGELVEGLIDKANDERNAQESRTVPSLVDTCCSWAKEREIKSLTQSDIKAILETAAPNLKGETIRAVWRQTNLKLKS